MTQKRGARRKLEASSRTARMQMLRLAVVVRLQARPKMVMKKKMMGCKNLRRREDLVRTAALKESQKASLQSKKRVDRKKPPIRGLRPEERASAGGRRANPKVTAAEDRKQDLSQNARNYASNL